MVSDRYLLLHNFKKNYVLENILAAFQVIICKLSQYSRLLCIAAQQNLNCKYTLYTAVKKIKKKAVHAGVFYSLTLKYKKTPNAHKLYLGFISLT